MDRSALAMLAAETIQILADGHYTSPSGATVDLTAAIAACVAASFEKSPDALTQLATAVLAAPPACAHTTCSVHNESTLTGAAALTRLSGQHPIGVLNFASARRPGGGFRNGAAAQEESLARSSALVAALARFPEFYAVHRRANDPRYSDRMIYAPGCPVFRDDAGKLLDTPYAVDFITSAAPNAGALARPRTRKSGELRALFRQRAQKVLALACAQGCTALVLGAWGCGVFRNDPELVAEIFAEALLAGGPFYGRFVHVRFSVLDDASAPRNLPAFAARFAPQ